VEIDQLQYELGAVRRRTDTEVCSLRQRIVDLELQVSEARKEADEYYRASVEHNTEATSLANQVIFSLIINNKNNIFLYAISKDCNNVVQWTLLIEQISLYVFLEVLLTTEGERSFMNCCSPKGTISPCTIFSHVGIPSAC